MPEPRSWAHTLCEPAQPKCTQHFTRATLYGNWQENAAAQNLGPRFVRACAVEMHSTQRFTRATVYGNWQEKCRDPEPRTTLCAGLRSRCTSTFHKSHFISKFTGRTQDHTSCEASQSKCTTVAILHGNLQEKCRARTTDHTVSEPAQSKCTWTFHKSHFLRKLTGKLLGPRVSTLIKHRPLHLL